MSAQAEQQAHREQLEEAYCRLEAAGQPPSGRALARQGQWPSLPRCTFCVPITSRSRLINM
jgi:hypothetical protein